MTRRWSKLTWAWRRLGRMHPVEIAYRAVEQFKRLVDRSRPKPWSAFGDFAGEVCGFPGFRLANLKPALRTALAAEARSAKEGRFAFFGQPWPDRGEEAQPWWDGDLWLIDPVSGGLWPGAARSAFDVSYRGDASRGDVKFVWELNRLQVLPPLALHAKLTGDEATAAMVFAILRGWMGANPPSRGVNWTSGIEAASRVVSLLAALAFVRPASAEDDGAVRAFLDAHVRWIAWYPSRFSSANNHRIAELTALFMAALCAKGLPRSADLARRARNALEREMLRQVHPDGVGVEQSLSYAAYSLEWFTLAGVAGDVEGRPLSQAYRDRARLALRHLCWMMDDAGQTPRIGDTDDSRVLALRQAPESRYVASVAAIAARWLGEPEPAPTLRDPALRYLVGAPTPTLASPTGAQTFAHGGLTVWRHPRPDGLLLLAFDHGPLGYRAIAAHGHADALAIWLHWGEEAVFIDPGMHLYHAGGAMRDALRGTSAHNTLALAGQDQSRIIGPFAWSRHVRARLIGATALEAEAEHDGYRRRFGLIHRRRVRLEGDTILIEDRVLGQAKTAALPWSLGFTLAPDITADIQGSAAHLITPNGRRLSLTSTRQDAPLDAWALAQTPYAPSFGSLKSTNRLELSGTIGATPLFIRTRIELAPDHHHRPL